MSNELYMMNELNIFLADDDKDDCNFFKEALEELQIPANLTMMYNGEQLMQALEKSAFIPDIVFLDLNMPRKNGFACLEEIKGSEKLKSIPVIIYSTSFDESIAERLYKNGAQHYICKPADFSQLKKVIHQAITLTFHYEGSRTKQPSKETFLLSNFKAILL